MLKPQFNPATKSDSQFKVNLKLKLISSYMLLSVFLIWEWTEHVGYGIFNFKLGKCFMMGQGYMCCIWVGMVLSKLLPCRHLTWILCPTYMYVSLCKFLSRCNCGWKSESDQHYQILSWACSGFFWSTLLLSTRVGGFTTLLNCIDIT